MLILEVFEVRFKTRVAHQVCLGSKGDLCVGRTGGSGGTAGPLVPNPPTSPTSEVGGCDASFPLAYPTGNGPDGIPVTRSGVVEADRAAPPDADITTDAMRARKNDASTFMG